MTNRIHRIGWLSLLLFSGLLYGCGGSTTPDSDRPIEEVEAELAPPSGGK